jgi:hypothetical protein
MARLFHPRHHSTRSHGRPGRRPLVIGMTVAAVVLLLVELAAIVLTRH